MSRFKWKKQRQVNDRRVEALRERLQACYEEQDTLWQQWGYSSNGVLVGKRRNLKWVDIGFPLLSAREEQVWLLPSCSLCSLSVKIGDHCEKVQAPGACEQGKEQTMADKRIHDASWDVVNSTHDANQVLANTMVTLLDRNAQFAQTTFLSGIEVLERETDDLRHLTHEWERQIQWQQDAFQKLAEGTMDSYLNFSRAWFSLSQQVWGVTRSAVDREFQFTQDAAQRAQDYSQ